MLGTYRVLIVQYAIASFALTWREEGAMIKYESLPVYKARHACVPLSAHLCPDQS